MTNILDNPNFVSWFRNSKVVDEKGNPLRVYHGSSRPDRVGKYFDPKRAKSGPMQYFTDSPEIASSYAMSKRDTSIEDETDYKQRFLIKIPGSRKPISIFEPYFWHTLPSIKREEIAKISPHIYYDEDSDSYDIDYSRYSPAGKETFEYEIRKNKGNYLLVLYTIWLESGTLFDEEKEFLKILDILGITGVQYDNPRDVNPGVIPVYLSLQNPLYADNIPQETINSLVQAAKRKRIPKQSTGVDQWDKSIANPKTWIQNLVQDDKYLWTTIPDWVTNTLKSLGYDGIIDNREGKSSNGHMVYIPFYPEQIKSATGNKGTYSPIKRNIHEDSLETEGARVIDMKLHSYL